MDTLHITRGDFDATVVLHYLRNTEVIDRMELRRLLQEACHVIAKQELMLTVARAKVADMAAILEWGK